MLKTMQMLWQLVLQAFYGISIQLSKEVTDGYINVYHKWDISNIIMSLIASVDDSVCVRNLLRHLNVISGVIRHVFANLNSRIS